MLHPIPTLPSVALIGRVNVGKSTLFNRIIGEPHSIVSPLPGTTRDVQETLITWRGIAFTLIDTGGFDVEDDRTGISEKVIAHSRRAAARADCVVLMTDARAGLLPTDRTIAEELRKSGKPIVVAVNKADNPAFREQKNEFWTLRLGEPLALSARNGSGVGDLLDQIIEQLATAAVAHTSKASPAESVRIAILGKPNVGKSTLLNAILGYERSIVSPHAHTTREPIDTPLLWKDTPLILIDTAGIRKKARVVRGLEAQGVSRSIHALKRSDVAILVLDLPEGINDQDKQLARLIEESGAALVIVGNKWDLVPRADQRRLTTRIHADTPPTPPLTQGGEQKRGLDMGAHYLNYIRGKFPSLPWAPVVFTSALTHANVQSVVETALKSARARAMTLEQPILDQFITDSLQRHSLPALGPKRKRPKVLGFKQTRTNPPAFALSLATRERFPESYLHFLEKELRKRYDFEGTPIRVTLKIVK
ncbi:MAG: ribosome biogenesis GTPase Der [Patescibacteria group bacterium]